MKKPDIDDYRNDDDFPHKYIKDMEIWDKETNPNQLTDDQIQIQDDIDGAIFEMLRDISGGAFEWDIEIIGDVRDAAIAALEKVSIKVEYPLIAD